ncbi:MAG: sensor histidine kinase [Nitrosopumilus sp.]|nr:sensor histidine kinase [Nitrosopumilus sp.]
MTNEIIKNIEEFTSFFINSISSDSTQRFEELQEQLMLRSDRPNIFNDNINLSLIRLNEDLNRKFSSLSYYNLEGLAVVSLNNSNNWLNLGNNISDSPIFRDVLQGNFYQDSHIRQSFISKDFFVVLSSPVYGQVTENISDVSKNKTAAVVVASYPVSYLLKGINNQIQNKNINLYLLSSNGTVVYSNQGTKTSKTDEDLPAISYSSNSIVGLKFTDQPIFAKIKDSTHSIESGIYPHINGTDGNSIFVSAKEVMNNDSFVIGNGNNNNNNNNNVNGSNFSNGWILISEFDANTAFKSMFNLRDIFVIITIGIMAVASLIALVVARSISIPLTNLRDSAKLIAGGNLHSIIKPSSNDEIGDLAKQFEKVRQSILKSNDTMSKKDIELQKINEELIGIEKQKDEFISMVSHELRTPLVPIKGYTEMLLKPNILGVLNEKQRKAVVSISRNTEKQESLVEDILDVYKFDMGKITLSKKEISISEILNNTINDLKTIVEDNMVSSITAEVNTKTVNTIICDEKRIEQVLANLIKNSLDFIPKKEGKIVIRVEEEKQQNATTATNNQNNHNGNENNTPTYIIFTIEDNGTGIPEDKIDNLFKKFYQLDYGVTRKHGGTGLGLVICKEIIDAHGGKIGFVRNSNIGKGTVVKFTLPIR